MGQPKLEMLKYVYDRPTVGQAFGECVKDMLTYMDGSDASVEQIVAISRRDWEAEQKDTHST